MSFDPSGGVLISIARFKSELSVCDVTSRGRVKRLNKSNRPRFGIDPRKCKLPTKEVYCCSIRIASRCVCAVCSNHGFGSVVGLTSTCRRNNGVLHVSARRNSIIGACMLSHPVTNVCMSRTTNVLFNLSIGTSRRVIGFPLRLR